MLINIKNEIVLKNLKPEVNLNLYSIEVSSKLTTDVNRQCFKGDNGKFYSFIDYNREFLNWLDSDLLNSLTLQKITEVTHDSITFWQEPNGWVTKAKADFINRNFNLIKARLSGLNKNGAEYFVSIDGLNPFMFNGISFDRYYNNCGEAISEKYPVMFLVINNKKGSDLIQDHFGFLRTDYGYRLISVTIKNGKIK